MRIKETLRRVPGIMPLVRFARALSCDPRPTLRAARALPGFVSDMVRYRRLAGMAGYDGFPLKFRDLYPCLRDKEASAGHMGAYFHQDLYVAREIYRRRPERHLDVGSRIDGFVGHLLVFMDVTIIDVRSLHEISGLSTISADARFLREIPDDSVDSLSCLHALEHFGLGRYGDEVDPDGWRKGLNELVRVLAPGGTLYLSVPIGKERLEFNGHRIFAPKTIMERLQSLRHVRTTVIAASGLVLETESPEDELNALNLSEYRDVVGIFECQKVAG